MRRSWPLVLCLLLGCATPRHKPPTYRPEWINRGSGADIEDGQRYFTGVGYISNVKSEKLQRLSATARARSEIAMVMKKYVRALFGLVSEELSRRVAPVSGESICIAGDKVPTFVQQRFDEVSITDEWNTGDEEFAAARARISFDALRAALLRMEMTPQAREVIEAKADEEFARFACLKLECEPMPDCCPK